MHIAAVAWLKFAKGLSLAASLRKAPMSPTGLRVSSTPLTSARDSRERESASWMSGPTMTAMMVKSTAAPRTMIIV
jgi:hypothetical protein